MYALYQANTHSWTFVLLAHSKQQSMFRHIDPLRHIILISSQSVLALNSGLESQSNALKASMLTITPPMQSQLFDQLQQYGICPDMANFSRH